jgi:hypothetical protein
MMHDELVERRDERRRPRLTEPAKVAGLERRLPVDGTGGRAGAAAMSDNRVFSSFISGRKCT